jgi:DNA sulfur modification protein DndE
MISPIKTVKVSEPAREQLIRLKRYTGISQWNILCRWALLRSLSEKTPPSPAPLPPMSNVEMSWSVFSGEFGGVYLRLIQVWCTQHGVEVDNNTLRSVFHTHLHRGIAYLASDKMRSIEDMV